MKLNELRPAKGSKKNKKIVGRGNGSKGSFCGKGMNGQNSRSGGGKGAGFEGGQMPLYRRLPKRGFSNYRFRKEYAVVNVSDLGKLDVETVDIALLKEKGLVSKSEDKVKLLGNGEIVKSMKVVVDKASKSAVEKIKNAGGSVEELEK